MQECSATGTARNKMERKEEITWKKKSEHEISSFGGLNNISGLHTPRAGTPLNSGGNSSRCYHTNLILHQ